MDAAQDARARLKYELAEAKRESKAMLAQVNTHVEEAKAVFDGRMYNV